MKEIKLNKPIFLVGPTCTGKSKTALFLAKGLNAEIISCDSMQVYRGMDIGTDKPDNEDRKEVRHHLIDIVDLSEEYNVGRYKEDAEKAISDIQERNKLPLVVGGTGLYAKALTDGLFEGPAKDEKVRSRLNERIKKEGADVLHNELKKIDPLTSEKVSPNDSRRTVRALEVYELTGKPISSFHKQWKRKEDCLIIGLNMDRQELYRRIEERVDNMFNTGLVEETKKLMENGLSENRTASQALGYKEILGYLKGGYDLERAKELIKRNTRRFAKRQLTWFRKDDRVKWIFVNKQENAQDTAEKILRLEEVRDISG